MDKNDKFVSAKIDNGRIRLNKSWIDKLNDKNIGDLAKEGAYATIYSLSAVYGSFAGLYAISTLVLPEYPLIESALAFGLTGVCYFATKESDKGYTNAYINRKIKELNK